MPDELRIDYTTGIISFRNDASNKDTYTDLKITVLASDGSEIHITGITVEKECGPSSTTVTPRIT